MRIYCVLTILHFFHWPFFNKIAIFVLSRDPWYHSRQMDFCPAAATTCSRVEQQSRDAKIMVRIHFVLTILQFVYSPFFQLNCYCRAIVRSMISQPKDGFLPRRWHKWIAFVSWKPRCKKNGEKVLWSEEFTLFFTHHFINYNATIPMVDRVFVRAMHEFAHVWK